ncbi:MAG TPA: isocitrate lyase/phosphoenolpyruvate mutase family protein [Armatimonadota bacterium]|nr:isocitrate lyase/phosphoenolpyruvate mutase family protein [Armatimonadota bacterium]
MKNISASASRAARLRAALDKPGPLLVAGAHNPLSARLVEEAGFDAVWASGFEISASQAVPDANILSFAENLEIARGIARAIETPVIADCDNGFGNAVNVIRTVREYEDAGIAGICIEDNIFPKRCSFYSGSRRELASAEEHAGKIRAAKGAQRDPSTFIIARTEALIAGWGQAEALRRAHAYADAGADAVLIHSKSKTLDELAEVSGKWTRDTPLVIVPTIFPEASAPECHAAGFKIVIFANHGLRSSIRAMQETLGELRRTQRIADVEPRIVPLKEVYRLVGVDEMNAQEADYLPVDGERVTAVIVGAGFEPEMLPLIKDRPKAMLDIRGKTILERQIETLNACNIKDIVVVRGYKKEAFTLTAPRYYDNDEYETTGELYSLFRAEPELRGRVLVLYSDVLFDQGILEKLLKAEGDINVVVDRAWYDHQRSGIAPERPYEDLVRTERAPSGGYRYLPNQGDSRVLQVGHDLPREECDGEFIGLMMLSSEGCEAVRHAYREACSSDPEAPYHEAPRLRQAKLTDLLQDLIQRGQTVHAVDTYKGWTEVDSFEDYQRAWADLR